MKKRWLSLLLAVCMVLSLMPPSASAASIVESGYCGDNVRYTLDSEGTLTISGEGNMSDYGYNNDSPFDSNESIKYVIIKSGVTSIGNDVFLFCSGMISVSIPNTVYSIGRNAFFSCTGLRTLTIPSSVTSIGRWAFSCCSSLTYATVDSSNTEYCSEDGVIFNKDKTKLVLCPAGRTGTYQIPYGVTEVGEYAFRGGQLTGVEIPSTVYSLEDGAFDGCMNLNNVTIAEGLERIRDNAFAKCESLPRITLPNSLRSIEDAVFQHCYSLTSLTIPKGVNHIGESVFNSCWNLNDITADSANAYFSSIDGVLFNKDQTELVYFPPARSGSYSVPDSVTAIGNTAFFYCNSITSLNLPYVKTVGEEAFEYCTKLAVITLPVKLTSIGENAFEDCDALTDVYYYGAQSDWNNISIADGNEPLTGANITYYNYPEIRTQPKDVSVHDGETARFTVSSYGTGLSYQWMYRTGTGNAWQEISGKTTSILSFTAYDYQNGYEYRCKVSNANGVTYSMSASLTVNNVRRTIKFDPNGGECDYIARVVIYGDTIGELPTPTRSGYTFVGWYTDPNGGSEVTADWIVYDSQTVYAHWTDSQCTVTFDPNGGECSVSSKTVYYGDTIGELPTPTRSGYTFMGWYPEPNGGPEFTSDRTIYSNETVYAIWTKNPCTVTFDPNGGECDLIKTTVSSGNKIGELPTPTRSGYTFAGWYTDPNGGSEITSDTIIYNHQTVYAHWTQSRYTVTFNANGGSVSPSSMTVTNGSTYGTLPTPTRSGYSFDGWYTASSGGSKITSSSTVNLTANQTLYARWATQGTQENEHFTWGEDNWNFNNNLTQGYFSSGRFIDQISSTYLNKLKSNLTNKEYDKVFNPDYGWLYRSWNGACYGMAALTHLAKNGLLPYSQYKSGATTLHELNYPKADSKVASLINYYQMLQVKDVVQQQYKLVPGRTNKQNIQAILAALEKYDTVLVGFQKIGWGGHAIVAYDVEYGSYTWNDVTYQGCIMVCDPKSAVEYDSSYNIYFNTTTYNWTIPGYPSMTSISGAVFNYIGSDLDEINQGGFLSGTDTTTVVDFIARLDAMKISSNRSIRKVYESNGSYYYNSSASDDIVEDYSYVLGGEREGTIGYNLFDADSAYKVSQGTPENLQLMMDYGDCSLGASSAAGNYVVFDKSGYVEVDSESAKYELSMTFNDNYPTDWFTVEASGNGANHVSIQKTDAGYLMEGNTLKNVTVSVNNRTDNESGTFSTSMSKALICETNAGDLDVRIDKNGDGVYETSVLNAGTALAITTQPKNYVGAVNSPAKFTVVATGDGLTYQWQYSDDGGSTWKKSSVTSSVYSATLTSAKSGRMVRCIVTDQYGSSVTSKAVSMKISGPTITTQPKNYVGPVNSTAKFTVVATGDGLTYQWQLSNDGTTWSNSSVKAASYSTKLTSAKNGKLVRCIVTDQYGGSVTSKAVSMKISGPTITTQPKNYVGAVNSTAKFTIAATGDGLTYQWQLSSDGSTWSNSSVKTNSYSTKLTSAKNGKLVRCIVTDQYGTSVTSNAVSMKISGPTITTQPKNYTGAVNSTAKFTVVATGSGLTYQWQYSDNGGSTWKKSSVTSSVYSATLTAAKNGRMVRCIVTDASGTSVTSKAVSMKISGITITTQPKNYVGALNSTAKFTIAATGDGLTYQWQLSNDGSTWSNSSVKTSSYSTKLTAAKDGKLVRCIVTDSYGNKVTSKVVNMTIG